MTPPGEWWVEGWPWPIFSMNWVVLVYDPLHSPGGSHDLASSMNRRSGVLVRGLLHPGVGPVIRVRVHGRRGSAGGLALLDTGASMSVLDRQLARSLELPSPGAVEWVAVAGAASHSMAALRRAQLEVIGDRRLFSLDLAEVDGLRDSTPGANVIVLLGWDFLDSCRLSCDGPSGAFELLLPAPPRVRSR